MTIGVYNEPWAFQRDSEKIAEFVFMGCDWMLKVNDDYKYFRQTNKPSSIGFLGYKYAYNYMGIKPDPDSGDSDDKLRIIAFESDPTDATSYEELWQCIPLTEPEILNNNPSGKRFHLLLEHQKRQFDASRQLFFLQDDKRTFLGSPVDPPPTRAVLHWGKHRYYLANLN